MLMPEVFTKTRRILVADDDPTIRRLITSLIEKDGYEPVVVNDGGAACRVLQNDANFCAAIFDMVMPNLAGIDVIRFMHTEKRLLRIPVMLVTSMEELELMASSFSAGATVFLRKPFRPEQFLAIFRLLVNDSNRRSLNPVQS